MSDTPLLSARERITQINRLNEAIVLARKRGQFELVEQLKSQVTQLLSLASLDSASSSPSFGSHASASVDTAFVSPLSAPNPSLDSASLVHSLASHASTSLDTESSVQSSTKERVEAASKQASESDVASDVSPETALTMMHQLKEINEQIVFARKEGEWERLQSLQRQAEQLIQRGLQHTTIKPKLR